MALLRLRKNLVSGQVEVVEMGSIAVWYFVFFERHRYKFTFLKVYNSTANFTCKEGLINYNAAITQYH